MVEIADLGSIVGVVATVALSLGVLGMLYFAVATARDDRHGHDPERGENGDERAEGT